jgi:hypothetical protein
MHTPNIQGYQKQREWVHPQLSELNINTQTQGGPIDYDAEYSFWFFHITNDSRGGS